MTTRKKNAANKNKTSAGQKKTPAHPTLRTAFCTNKKGSGTRGEGTGSRDQSEESRMTSLESQTALLESQNASLESQIAMLEEQIAKLVASGQGPVAGVQSSKGKGQSERREQSSESRVENENHSAFRTLHSALPNEESGNQSAEHGVEHSALRSCAGGTGTLHSALHSALPKAGPPLTTPVIENMTAIGSSFMRVSWSPVTNASGYLLRYSTDETFTTNVDAVTTDVSVTEATLNGLQANTTYYVSVKAIGSGIYLDSPFSTVQPATTGSATDDDIVTHLQSWLDEQQTAFENASTLLPQLDTTVLTTAERRRLNGSGVRRYGFIDKVSDVAEQYPQFWPAAVSGSGGTVDFQDKLKERLREIEVLRNLLVWSNFVSRVTGDLLLLAGDDAFRMANTYYATVRTAARSNLPEARQVFQMIDLFWRRPRRTAEEPTIPEVERDMRALLRGTKDGEIVVRNESDRVVKGERVLIDNTMKAIPRGGVKVIETGEVASG
ncbi:MAG: fibronectin type III domain-containing protein [Planctomycetaceae bacterium]|nr:fibronectin type III domain-containing protein [Planctomycetaceae bacterium]